MYVSMDYVKCMHGLCVNMYDHIDQTADAGAALPSVQHARVTPTALRRSIPALTSFFYSSSR